MSKNARKALFYILFLAFIFLGTGIVLFAQGWRVDFPSFHISKVGGIYVRSYPDGANIFLNGKSVQNQSGFLSPGTLISDLFPKTYVLALTAPGYRDWHENVAVAPSLVANHKNAVLVPATSEPAASGTVTSFLVTQNGPIIETPNRALTLNGNLIGAGTIVAANSNTGSLIFRNLTGTYDAVALPGGRPKNLSSALLKAGFDPANQRLIVSPLPNGDVFAITQKKAALLDISQATSVILDTLSPTIKDPVVAASPSGIAWLHGMRTDGPAVLAFYDPSSGTVSTTSIAIRSSVKELSWISGSTLGVLTDNNSLYLYRTDQKTLQKLADDVRSFSATQDGNRIATLESRSMEIFTLNDPEGYYRFNIPDVTDAVAAIWYRDNDHLFIAYPGSISFLDLQDATLANFISITAGTSPEYDPSQNILYFIAPDNTLRQFSFPK